MSQKRANRRLAAILAADVIGYSRMMGANEYGTLMAVKLLRTSTMEGPLKRFEGRLIKTTGDGFLFEFGSVFDAFDFAATIQGRAADKEALQLRMGLNVGDIIFDDGDVFGDGVNIAARLEPLSPPGGLLVSNRAWEDLRRLPLAFEDAGEIELKNIKESLRAWSLQNEQLREYSDALEVDRDEPTPSQPGLQDARPVHRASISRRALLGAVTSAAAISAGGTAYWQFTKARSQVDPAVAALLDQAWQAWAQGTGEGNSQAIGLYRRATSLAPDHADAWGFLGCAYGDRGHAWVAGAERTATWQRARDAGQKALSLDAENAYGRAAIAYARPRRGNWTLMERGFLQANQDQPGKWLIAYSLGLLLGEVGRFQEAANLFGTLREMAPTATQYRYHVEALWACGQLDQAERLLDEAAEIYASSAIIWWQRFDMLLQSGRPTAAVALAENSDRRPAGIAGDQLKHAVTVAKALISQNTAVIESSLDRVRAKARESTSLAIEAMAHASLFGDTDTAFVIAIALFFSRGFQISDRPGAPAQQLQVTLDDRSTRYLFLPTAKAMWADPRFPSLLQELGLASYWRKTNTVPDFRKT